MRSSRLEKRALFIGRFQPFHLGHLSVLDSVDKSWDFDEIIVAIGSSQYSFVYDNPFTAAERRQMIACSVCLVTPFKIVEIPDLHNDKKWADKVFETCGKFDTLFTGNSWVGGLFAGKGVHIICPKQEIAVSGTLVRELMAMRDREWRGCVPEGVRKVLDAISAEERLAGIAGGFVATKDKTDICRRKMQL